MKTPMTIRWRTAAAALSAMLLAAPAFAGDASPKCAGATCTGACAAIDPAEHQQLSEMVDRQRDELVSLTRTLAAERRYQSELEAKLAATRAAAPAPQVVADSSPGQAALEAENRRLRQQLDIEREENEKLVAKLRTASRVADLVFRSAPAEAPLPPPADSEPEVRSDRTDAD